MAPFRLFAMLTDGAGGRCRIFCDDNQHFLFERTRDGVTMERFRSDDPERFHWYTHELCAKGWDFAWAPRKGAEVGN